jgi:class 3 adenylate cyclase
MAKGEDARVSQNLHDGSDDSVQAELDRRVYHLRTLYDVSKEIFGTLDYDKLLRSFLLMTLGNFGVIEGFILTCEGTVNKPSHFVSMGFQLMNDDSWQTSAMAFLRERQGLDSGRWGEVEMDPPEFPKGVVCLVPFKTEEACSGLLALGNKLTEEPFSEDDRELLTTLVNNLVVALDNARSFEKISRLNEELQEQNVQLEKALRELRSAMRKVEILEGIKANLCKFVPTTVTRLVEQSPSLDIFDSKERDVTVLFLDIEGYTKITERVGGTGVNTLIEKYFSVFMDAIYENNGDVVETSGDGLMVLFLTEDEAVNALEAIRAAVTIQEKTSLINQECATDSQPLVINIGICSGHAFVGAAKFESYTGARWTYTSHGTVTNVAARICAQATGGSVLASRSTVERAEDHFTFTPLGKCRLKNVSEEVEIFELALSPRRHPPAAPNPFSN